MKHLSINFLIAAVAAVLSILLVEFVARQMFDPVDMLLPRVVEDKELGHRIEAFSGGHDALGFRNLERPRTASVVAIGDSMTYGISATRSGAWPAQLEKLSGLTVYNMGLGGYGPVQYVELLRSRAPLLGPKTVIMTFYVGNDLLDINTMERGSTTDGNVVVEDGTQRGTVKALRDWLASRSVLYRVITQSPLFDFIRMREGTARAGTMVIDGHILAPQHILGLIDLDKPALAAALRRLETLVGEAAAIASERGYKLVLAVMPTKETVYYKALKDRLPPEQVATFERVVHNEAQFVETVLGAAKRHNLAGIDLSLRLIAGVRARQMVYPPNDGHPNQDGYLLVAREIFESGLLR